MKYLSVIFFVVAMIWTWNLIHSTPAVSFETHSGIQERLAGILEETIKTKKPDSTDIKIEKIWTELLMGGRVKAHFSYSFKSPVEGGTLVETKIEGEGILDRKEDDGSGMDRWILSEIKTNSDSMVFDDPLVVGPNTPTEQAPAEQKPTETTTK